MSKTAARRQARWRQQRARRAAAPRDEAMTRFERLVVVAIVFEAAMLLWITGIIRPLG